MESKIEEYYYYTRWTFEGFPDTLDDKGPFHSTWVTSRKPQEFWNDTLANNLKEFFFKKFDSEAEMQEYWKSVNPEI